MFSEDALATEVAESHDTGLLRLLPGVESIINRLVVPDPDRFSINFTRVVIRQLSNVILAIDLELSTLHELVLEIIDRHQGVNPFLDIRFHSCLVWKLQLTQDVVSRRPGLHIEEGKT